jgi:hypothetical protein
VFWSDLHYSFLNLTWVLCAKEKYFVSKNIGYEFVFKASCVASSKSQVVFWWMWWCHILMKGCIATHLSLQIVCYHCMHTQFWMLMTLFSFHPFALEYLNPQKLDNGWTWKVGVPSFLINFLLPIHPRNWANLLEFIYYSFTLSTISPCLPLSQFHEFIQVF